MQIHKVHPAKKTRGAIHYHHQPVAPADIKACRKVVKKQVQKQHLAGLLFDSRPRLVKHT